MRTITMTLAALVAASMLTSPAMAEDEAVSDEFRRLHEVRQAKRPQLLSIPGVVGFGTELRDDRAVLTVYVEEDTPAVRSTIAAKLAGEPYEIIEKPGGFIAY